MNTRLLRRGSPGLEALLADWFAANRYASVTTEDFLEFVGEWTQEPDYWSKFFEEWIYRSPCPTISFDEYAYSDGRVWLSVSRSGEQRIEELELVFDTGTEPTVYKASFLVGDALKVYANRIELEIEVPSEPSGIAVDPDGLYVLRLALGQQWQGPRVEQSL
jgi:hypothetical protein